MVVLVGRKERMWQSKGFGRLLSLSMASSLFSSSAMIVSFLEIKEKTNRECLNFEFGLTISTFCHLS